MLYSCYAHEVYNNLESTAYGESFGLTLGYNSLQIEATFRCSAVSNVRLLVLYDTGKIVKMKCGLTVYDLKLYLTECFFRYL